MSKPNHAQTLPLLDLETKENEDGTTAIEGYASTFKVDKSGDRFSVGAFSRSLREFAKNPRQIKMLFQHDPASPIGVWDEMAEDSKGLRVKGTILTQLSKAREVSLMLKSGILDGLSVGYVPTQLARANAGESAKVRRVINQADLVEVSLVSFPMNPGARVTSVKRGDLTTDDARVLVEQLNQLSEAIRR